MGKKSKELQRRLDDLQRRYDQSLQSFQTTVNETKAPSAMETELSNQALEGLNFFKGGDFRSTPKNIFFNFANPADQLKQRELIMNVGNTGTSALGAGNETLLKLNRENLQDEFARDTAQNYQQNMAGAAAGILGQGNQSVGQDLSRKTAVMGGMGQLAGLQGQAMGQAAGMLQQQQNKPKWWQSLLGSAGSIIGGLGSAGLKL